MAVVALFRPLWWCLLGPQLRVSIYTSEPPEIFNMVNVSASRDDFKVHENVEKAKIKRV